MSAKLPCLCWRAPVSKIKGTLNAEIKQAFGYLQMGTAEDVRAAEQTMVTLSCVKGMMMHAIPRVAPVRVGSRQPFCENHFCQRREKLQSRKRVHSIEAQGSLIKLGDSRVQNYLGQPELV